MGNDVGQSMEGMKVAGTMAVVQVAAAAVNIFYKLAANDGMSLSVLLSYRFLIAVAFFGPLSFFLERGKRPKLTWTVLGQAFLSGLLGGSLSQNLYMAGMVFTSITTASVITNLVPAITFMLALCFGMEKLGLRTVHGKAKAFGTILGISGAMVLTFYKGIDINLGSSPFHLHSSRHNSINSSPPSGSKDALGIILCLSCAFFFAGWYIAQTKMSNSYPCHYTSTALMSLMAWIQSTVYALAVNRDLNDWKLGWNIRLIAVLYTGTMMGLMILVNTWCMQLRGPLFVSAFSPLMLVMVAIASYLILNEKLHLGSIIGAGLIVVGLYSVLWGKMREARKMNRLVPITTKSDDHHENVVEIAAAVSPRNDSDQGSGAPPSSKEGKYLVAK